MTTYRVPLTILVDNVLSLDAARDAVQRTIIEPLAAFEWCLRGGDPQCCCMHHFIWSEFDDDASRPQLTVAGRDATTETD